MRVRMYIYEILKIKIIISKKKKEIFKIDNLSVDSMIRVKGPSLMSVHYIQGSRVPTVRKKEPLFHNA